MQILFSQQNLGEGLNLGVSQYQNKSGECREGTNCDFTIVGELARMLGYTTYGSGLDASSLLGLYDFKGAGTIMKWLAKTGSVLYSDESGVWTARQTGLISGAEVTFATHIDNVIMGGVSDAPIKTSDGVTWTPLLGSPPTAKYWLTFDNKVYALNQAGFTSRMQWSDDGTIETWTGTNIQDVTTNIGIGDQLTGGTVNNNSLIVFKNYSTWKWDAFELRVLHASVGCRAPKSIATIDDWTFWLSHKGIMASNGGKPFRISKAVKPYVDQIADITAPVGWAEDNFYYLYIGTVTVNGETFTNCLLRYDYDNSVWSVKPLADVVKQAAILTTVANVRSAYIGNDAGQVYKFNTGNVDNSTAIPFKWVGAPQMSGSVHLEKDYKYLYVLLDRTAKYGIDVFYSLNFQDFKPLGTAKEVVSELAFPAGSKGHNIRIAYETNLTTDQQKILGHVCLGEILPGRLGSVR